MRFFVLLFFCSCLLLFLADVSPVAAISSSKRNKKPLKRYRGNEDEGDYDGDDGLYPNFHPRPAKNWVNDPNGPFYDPKHEKYHLFFQYNPYGAAWGSMSWAHLISEDLVFWRELPVILYPDMWYDRSGVFSGSVTLDEQGDPVLFYTCVDSKGNQLQCKALPSDREDPNLEAWTKAKANPVIDAFPPRVLPSEFRDPSTAFQLKAGEGHDDDDRWFTAYSALEGLGPVSRNAQGRLQYEAYVPSIPLYAAPSPGSESWELVGNMFEGPPQASSKFGRYECPDFFYLSEEEGDSLSVLKISKTDYWADYYSIGTFDPQQLTFSAPSETSWLPLDGGKFYASKTFTKADGARVLIGWIMEEDSLYSQRGWAGLHSLPRQVLFDEELSILRTPPIDEVSSLREDVLYSLLDEKVGSEVFTSVRSPRFEVEVQFSVRDPLMDCALNLKVRSSEDDSQYTIVSLSPSALSVKRAHAGGSSPHTPKKMELASAKQDRLRDVLSLRVFVDGSVVEAFANDGEAVVSARVYPPKGQVGFSFFSSHAKQCPLEVTSLTVYSMKKAVE